CEGALKKDTYWINPGMRLRGARPRGETLRLHVPAEVRLERWKTNDFRLTQVAQETGADDVQVLTLQENLPTKFAPQRPAAWLKTPVIQVLTRQKTLWHITPNGSTLTSAVQYRLAQGRLFKLQ